MTVDGKALTLPLAEIENAALVHDYQSEGLNVYLKDVRFDEQDRPVLLYLTSKGYQAGPMNDPRTWTIAHWTGSEWKIRPITTSDNNYDFGELHLRSSDDWRIIAPTETGPQPFNPGGEVVMWSSTDQGDTWTKQCQLTAGSSRNHSYVRQPQDAHPDFLAFWADGHGRKPSESHLFFANDQGSVFELPRYLKGENAQPKRIEKQ